jgi:hypothetical protein
MAAIPPSLLPTSLSHLALVVYLMSLNLVPLSIFLFPASSIPVLFWCFDVLLFSVFCVFFLQFLPIFSALVSLPSVHCWAFFAPPPQRASTVLFFVRDQRTCDWFLSLYFFLLIFSSASFLFTVFRLLFACNNALASMVRLDSL